MSLSETEMTEFIKGVMAGAMYGSEYWCCLVDHNRKELELEFVEDVLTHPKGYWLVRDKYDEEAMPVFVTRLDMERAFQTLRTDDRYWKTFVRYMAEQQDAGDDDNVFQLAAFDKLVFG